MRAGCPWELKSLQKCLIVMLKEIRNNKMFQEQTNDFNQKKQLKANDILSESNGQTNSDDGRKTNESRQTS